MQRITRRQYTDDFKTQAIALAESIGRAKAARELDMSVKTLGNWLDASRARSKGSIKGVRVIDFGSTKAIKGVRVIDFGSTKG